MKTIELIQGHPEWHTYRASARNASDVPAMLGISPYKTRAELLQEKATGITPEVTPAQQRIFDGGHIIEALARPLAEAVIGDALSPVIGQSDCGQYSASFDGLTFMGDAAWECKSLNANLRAALPYAGQIHDESYGARLPEHYRAQMEQQAMVSGCQRILFTAAALGDDGTLTDVRHCWYTPDPAMRSRIIAGWAQFDRDVATWQPTEAAAPVQAAPVESLPAVVVQVQGSLAIAGNLPAFGQALRDFIERIPTKPATDQQFADAEAACKALKKAEEALTSAEENALAQVSDVEAMRRTVADLKALARQTRLTTEKLVAAEKEARKTAIVMEAQHALEVHVAQLNQELSLQGAGQLPQPSMGIFAGHIKGLKSLDSMREKVTAALLGVKADASTSAQRLRENRASLRREDGDWIALFADFTQVGTKPAEDFAALAHVRISQHQQAEAVRLEKERQRIEAEARAKAEREAQAKAQAELEAERQRIRAEEQAKAQMEAARLEQQRQREAEAHQVINHVSDLMHAPAPAKTANQAPLETADGETLTLGQINALLAPISINAAGLAELGFEPVATAKAAKLYNESDFPAICRAIAQHIQDVATVNA